jgi:hypothetical protein
VPQHPLGIKGVYGHLQEMKCCSRTLFCHCRTCRIRHLFSYMRQWFWTCVGAFHLLEVAQHPFGTEGMCGHLHEMKCYSRTLFCHCCTCQTRHLFSYMRQWFWDLSWSISPLGGGSTPPWYRGGVWTLPGNEMLQQDLVLP